MEPGPLQIVHEHPTLRVDERRLHTILHALFEAEGATPLDITLVLTGHADVRALNVEYLGHDYDTDVLSFLLSDGTSDGIEGEVYVDLDTALERHAEFDAPFEDEALRYCIHGVLHLLGYDDATATERDAMRALETRYLYT